MPVICPQCAFDNPDGASFCARCRIRLQSPDIQVANNPAEGPVSPVPATAPSYTPPQAPFPAPTYPPYAPPRPSTRLVRPYQQSPSPRSGQRLDMLQRAFAGYGTPISQHSWLLPNEQAQAVATQTALTETLRQQGAISVTSERIKEHGLQTRERDYIAARQGTSIAFIYVTSLGRDLYISRTTTVRSAISYIRATVFGLLVLAMIIGFIIFNVIQTSTQTSLSAFELASTTHSFFGYLSYALLALIIILLVRSLFLLLTDKDFLALLRPNTLSDFQVDEVASLEQITGHAVRDAVKQAGIDSQNIISPQEGYRPGRRFRLI